MRSDRLKAAIITVLLLVWLTFTVRVIVLGCKVIPDTQQRMEQAEQQARSR